MGLFAQVPSSVGNSDGVWYNAYQGSSRAHEALNALNRVDESEEPEKQVRLAEMRFLRGWIYYKLKKRYKWLPWFDENATTEDNQDLSYRPERMTERELWQKIDDDVKYTTADAAHDASHVT